MLALDTTVTPMRTYDFLNLDTSVLEIDPHALQHLGRNAGGLADQTQQYLLCAHKVVA